MASTPTLRAHIGWRLLALSYDFWPVAALWMLTSAAFNVAYSLAGHARREYVAPFTWLGTLLWITCWLIAGIYAVVSWQRGGQTIGMRPWRLRLVGLHAPPDRRALAIRYLVGTVSLLLGGLGFWWAWIDRDRLTWHDRASGTRMERIAKRG
ncbi:RDD family protein [Cognatilysobacter lacus]|uniref:RDD family protein n=1 Tax=Cognatilysobacter lacus TaxID=1643323 RepID=A0A5D8ZB22_9GAMM|nr:RDD family protein [Lysobacter lacus]TZF91253.1 RDD family protein [Lysobacter lacus]